MNAPQPVDPTSAAARRQQLLEQLAELLQSEFDTLLQAHDARRIEEIAERKRELCARIEALPTTGDETLEQPLRLLAQEVARCNQRNGAVLSALIRNTRGALDVLRGTPARTAVYDPRGRTQEAAAARPLGSA